MVVELEHTGRLVDPTFWLLPSTRVVVNGFVLMVLNEPLEKDAGKMHETKLLSSSQESLSEIFLRRRAVHTFPEEEWPESD